MRKFRLASEIILLILFVETIGRKLPDPITGLLVEREGALLGQALLCFRSKDFVGAKGTLRKTCLGMTIHLVKRLF